MMCDRTYDSIQLDDSPVDFEKTTKGFTDNPSQTDGLNNDLEVDLKRLKYSVKELREGYCKNMRSHFTDHVISSNKLCNHYTGFPSVDVLNAVFEYSDPGINSENVILYNYQKIKNCSSAAGRPRKLDPFESYMLILVRLRQNFDLNHFCFLYGISEGTVSNTISTRKNYMYLCLGSIYIWPRNKQIAKIIPSSMKEKCPNVQCIIGYVEFKFETPPSFVLYKMKYSDYKSHTTIKIFVGIASGGGFTFISNISWQHF